MESKKFYQATWFLWICGIVIPIVGIILLWTVHKKKSIGFKIGLTVIFALWLILVMAIKGRDKTTEKSETNVEEVTSINSEIVEEDTSSEIEAENKEQADETSQESSTDELTLLKQELKDKYDISEPDKFVRGDATGNWRIVKVANGTATTEYAVDYAKAYMTDGDIHYIVNFTLKTTTQLRLSLGILSVKTTEYVDNEEHDASIIGEGMILGEHYYNMETGEEISTEGDESAGTVEDIELITTVTEAIEGQVGSGEKITEVTFDGKTLTVKVDLSGADTSKLSPELIAESRVSSITDKILQLEDKYYNTWEVLTVDFGDIGAISFNKSDVKDQGLGRFVEVPAGYFE